MSLKSFLNVSGEILFEEKFISLRMIKAALEPRFRTRILEESPKHLSCKIIRFARLYGAPIPFPNPTLDLKIKDEKNTSIIHYELISFDYYVVLAAAALGGILAPNALNTTTISESIVKGVSFFSLILVFYGLLVFLDTKYFVWRIRKALMKI